MQTFFSFFKTSSLNEEINFTEPSSSVGVPWPYAPAYFTIELELKRKDLKFCQSNEKHLFLKLFCSSAVNTTNPFSLLLKEKKK
jgi:hypothetical protein